MIDEKALNIYADGSSKPKPRRGGIGIRYVFINDLGEEVTQDLALPGYLGATNNEMELKACVIGLQNAVPYLSDKNFEYIVVHTDSNYVVTNYNNALFLWPKTKWLKKDGGPVLNTRLWKDLVKWTVKVRKYVYIRKVKGHSEDVHNKEVDRQAKQSAEYPINKPISPSIVRRKKSKRKTRVGSVAMLGQKITIRIDQGWYLPVQKLYRYRYEVMSKSSEYYQNVDFICTYEMLRETHTYFVRLNKETSNPRIAKVFREIPKK